jgi:hypothetical protein
LKTIVGRLNCFEGGGHRFESCRVRHLFVGGSTRQERPLGVEAAMALTRAPFLHSRLRPARYLPCDQLLTWCLREIGAFDGRIPTPKLTKRVVDAAESREQDYVSHTDVISAATREAPYVLDGLRHRELQDFSRAYPDD